MTIQNPQELLKTASAFCSMAEYETDRSSGTLERAAQYAAIAHAHAVTAQAMLACAQYEDDQASIERSELRAIWNAS